MVEEEENVTAWMREETRRRSIPSGSGGSQTATAENGRKGTDEIKGKTNKPQADLETTHNRGGCRKRKGLRGEWDSGGRSGERTQIETRQASDTAASERTNSLLDWKF